MSEPHRPLADVLVVDLSRHLPGPLVSRILADLGARVLKVEEPTSGDPVRRAPPIVAGVGSLASLLLAGTRSVALDLKRAPAVEVLETLLEETDVLVESFRPGTMARLGLDPRRLRERYPRLVICSVSGWGQEGPGSGRAGHDLTYQAVGGSLAPTGGMPAVPVADVVGAWSGAAAVLAALFRRQETGEGSHVDQALLDGAIHANAVSWSMEAKGPKGVGERLPLTGALPCYGIYETEDGRLLAVAALEPHFWRRFCAATGRRDLVGRQYETTGEARRAVAETVADRPLEAWVAIAEEEDLPVAAVRSASEALEHPQVAARDLVRFVADGTPRLGFPALLDGERPRGGEEVPGLGADTEAVLEERRIEVGGSRRRRRRQGIGRRRSLGAWLADWLAKRFSG